jgi:quercetin dioxygenase-like cupin family protein
MRRMVILSGIAALGTAVAALAQPDPRVPPTPGLTQSNIMREALARFPGTDVMVFNGEFAPGATPGRHRHPGPEILYVISGEGVLLQDGRDPVPLSAGKTVISEPPEGTTSFAHEVRNTSATEPLKTYIVLLIGKDQPPALPAD